MKIYKNYFKILRSCYSVIIMYFCITLVITIIGFSNSKPEEQFVEKKLTIGILDNDKTTFSNNFVNYLKEKADVINIENDTEKIKDALFFGKISGYIVIPTQFIESIKNNEKNVDILRFSNTSASIQLENLVNKYLNIARVYLEMNIPEEKIQEYVMIDLEKEIKIDFATDFEKRTNLQSMSYYFNYLNYSLLSIIILTVSLIMSSYNSDEIKARNMMAPISTTRYNFEIILGNITLSIIIWLAFVIFAVILQPSVMISLNGLLFMINSLIFTQVALAIGYIIGSFVKNPEVQSGFTNIIGLGTSFIGGAFVPQELLGKTVLFFASFTPTYWYVKTNNLIANNNLSDIISKITVNIIIQLAFIVLLYAIVNIIKNRKKYIN